MKETADKKQKRNNLYIYPIKKNQNRAQHSSKNTKRRASIMSNTKQYRFNKKY